MVVLLTVVLAQAWGEVSAPEGRSAARAAVGPTATDRREAFELVQQTFSRWQLERRELLRDQQAQEQARLRLASSQAEAQAIADGVVDPEPEELKRYGKVVTVGGATRERVPSKGRGKVIEVRPADPLADELEAAEAKLEERRAACAADPKACEARRRERERMKAGNAAFERAIVAAYEKRRAAIEAEAQAMAARIEAAREAEAQAQARRLGGSLDAEGQFVDGDLQGKSPGHD
jgi:hypothetical protein